MKVILLVLRINVEKMILIQKNEIHEKLTAQKNKRGCLKSKTVSFFVRYACHISLGCKSRTCHPTGNVSQRQGCFL